RARHLGIVERMPHAGDFLVRLVALAGDQYDVAGARGPDRAGDRGSAVALHQRGIRPAEALEDVGDDRVAVLATRVVVGDDHEIGAGFRDRRHLRALADIALAAA